MSYHDEFKSDRFKSAVAIGRYADRLFREECRKRGLDPATATLANLASETPVPMRVTMLDDDILNLWQEGLSRPEIMALGCSYNEFQGAIKRARSVGDLRAYYRQGKSRLPWQVNLTARAKQKAQEHRIISNEQELRKMDKRPSKPRSPSVGPSFVGKAVDDLVVIFAQIDEAKRELDKRFVPNSDILRTEVNKD